MSEESTDLIVKEIDHKRINFEEISESSSDSLGTFDL